MMIRRHSFSARLSLPATNDFRFVFLASVFTTRQEPRSPEAKTPSASRVSIGRVRPLISGRVPLGEGVARGLDSARLGVDPNHDGMADGGLERLHPVTSRTKL